MKLFLTLFLITLTTSIYAQALKTIKYDGLVHISENIALRMLTFEAGDDIKIEDVDTAIKKGADGLLTHVKMIFMPDEYEKFKRNASNLFLKIITDNRKNFNYTNMYDFIYNNTKQLFRPGVFNYKLVYRQLYKLSRYFNIDMLTDKYFIGRFEERDDSILSNKLYKLDNYFNNPFFIIS
jgi:hypothetical protein